MIEKIEGYLEVGLTENDEIVINHPDLKPDANGVGHIIFSINQAEHLAAILTRKAAEAANNIRAKQEEGQRAAAEAIPVDRSSVTLTDGSPVTEDHRELKQNGQQKGYVVLSEEERAKGFVRPLRTAYVHVGCRPKFTIRGLSAEEKERYEKCGYVAYEEYPAPETLGTGTVGPVGRFWTKQQLESGCGGVTTMGRAIAETYARDPKFYGGTFCVRCGKHFPVGADGEFVWVDERTGRQTDERVGT